MGLEHHRGKAWNPKWNDLTMEEPTLLRLAAAVGKSERTIKTRTVALQEKGYLRRANGKRSGHWEVLVDLS